ncbi:LacI family DNA-binding transcriptional regulator [Kiritimatiellaeota bacterium B1221]|nr:LacI family DNA-binding transcriptional regulator [Kiritimatiellaeota bacterium B1221]
MTTLKDISIRTGVSINAVSRILNGLNKENRPSSIRRAEQVRRVAAEMGYRPNEAARAMKSGAFKSIMLLKDNANAYSSIDDAALFAVQQVLAPLGYRLVLTLLPEAGDPGSVLSEHIRQQCVDGILTSMTKNIPPWLETTLSRTRTPIMWIGSKLVTDSVRHDDYQSGFDGTVRLLEAGHRKIVYADFAAALSEQSDWHFSTLDRQQGYLDAMREWQVSPEILRPATPLKQLDGIDYIKDKLLPLQPTAVFCYGLWHTGRALLYACAGEGIRIPEALSFLTWMGEPNMESGISLSGYEARDTEIWTRGTQLLLEKIRSNEPKPSLVLPFKIRPGESVGAPKRV